MSRIPKTITSSDEGTRSRVPSHSTSAVNWTVRSGTGAQSPEGEHLKGDVRTDPRDDEQQMAEDEDLVGGHGANLVAHGDRNARLQLRHRPGREHRLHRRPIAVRGPSEEGLGDQPQPQVEPQRPPPEPLAPRSYARLSAARQLSVPVAANPRASRRRASTSPGRGGRSGTPPGRSTAAPRPRPRADRGRRPRRTCAAPDRTGPGGAGAPSARRCRRPSAS